MSECAWLVDMGYVVKVAKMINMKLDYVAGRDFLSNRYGSTATFLFNSVDESFGIPDGLYRFYHAMEQQGMTVCLHPMSGDISAGDHRQRRVDVDFASHAVWQASVNDVKTVVLTIGDQDMVPAVKLCQDKLGVQVVLFTFRRNVSKALTDLANEHLFFEDHRGQLDR
jgi:uncharacterized LabA/DUF88 family protein